MHDLAVVAVAVLGGERLVAAEPELNTAAMAMAFKFLVEGLA
jgi:hypothetical protein